ncbi:hypothetical protein ACG83_39595 [Frankia sp. R43]|uniref:helicase-related protein n=1 Tax=Frankia sp. R43 TaxID=269536 RepID=UPI0006CA3F93|nr:helicase-related protein [Frankia sp. R43]KPM50638.1 hypothetical protein ACG83_39595 [Frankia sp. R43]
MIFLAGHFAQPVRVEDYEEIAEGVYLLRVRHSSGAPDETQVTADELSAAIASSASVENALVSPADLFLWVESQRIRLAFAHDPLFAVSLSGVRGLPHQIEAVYRHMLPQPRLRFVLADDPGAGKTIMSGLLLKELRLRAAVERCLILCPAPLTTQWQDEMMDKFDEQFEIINSERTHRQLGGNAWERYSLAIASIDFAKQESVRGDLLRTEWDLVIVDEAHKASAFTKRGRDESIVKTKRYTLVEGVAQRSERLLLLTATPHSGDEDRFTRFLGLLDPDQFSTADLVKRQIGIPDNPFFLRRQKEDLRDERGGDLFVPRHVRTQPFELSKQERNLYLAVTEYVNTYLGNTPGRRGNAVALARTVLQRRLASSIGAIHSSLVKRANRLEEVADSLEKMTASERRRRLDSLARIPAEASIDDAESGTDDIDEDSDDYLATQVSGATQIADLRAEVTSLRQLAKNAEGVMGLGEERKLAALRRCLEGAALAELRDGRGKLLIFTEHRDTLSYLERHLQNWGYSVCSIHGGLHAAARKKVQHDFRANKQICLATEAAGEGINLQFCHLMINYDLPWNPVRLEQRMGRVHRIGQTTECWVFNFCAVNTVEGQLLERLHRKLADMAGDLGGRVYDVIGELLAINGVDFERLVRDTLANPTSANTRRAMEEIGRIDPEKLKEYEQATGIALARKYVDVEWVRGQSFLSEERRLMPEYVESFFLAAAEREKLRVERRADTLLRVEHVPIALRSDDLASVRQRGRSEAEYRKLTFRKEQRDKVEHEDATLCSPGHPLFAALTERLGQDLANAGVPQATATFVDPAATEPYLIHLFAYEVVGESTHGRPEAVYAEVVAVIADGNGLQQGPADVLHTLTPAPNHQGSVPTTDEVKTATDWVRARVQMARTGVERTNRRAQADMSAEYLTNAIAAQERRLQDRWLAYDEKVAAGDDSYRLLRDNAERGLVELKRRSSTKLETLGRLGVVRPGKVTHLGTASVMPPIVPEDPDFEVMRPSKEVEDAAIEVAMAYERQHGWDPEYVGDVHDGSGFDIRSTRTVDGGAVHVRRIEVKGRSSVSGDVGLYRTEWFAAQRWGEGFWLYVIYDALAADPNLIRIQNPYTNLLNVAAISQVTGYRVPASSIRAHS